MPSIDDAFGFLTYLQQFALNAFGSIYEWLWMILVPLLTLYIIGAGFFIMHQNWSGLRNYMLWPFRALLAPWRWMLAHLFAGVMWLVRLVVWFVRWKIWVIVWIVSRAAYWIHRAAEWLLARVRPASRP